MNMLQGGTIRGPDANIDTAAETTRTVVLSGALRPALLIIIFARTANHIAFYL